MGKWKMPTAQQFLKKKRIFGPRPTPVWVYLEQEMRANVDKKPYNDKVGKWLAFLKDLRYHYHCEARRKYRRLEREAGPPWYYEFSRKQREILVQLKDDIHQDLIEEVPSRIKLSLWELGVTINFPNEMLLAAMKDCAEDPGVFMWCLYSDYFKVSPNELLPKYTLDMMVMLSALVFIDLEECIQTLEKVTPRKPPPPPPPPKKKPKYFQPNVRYGEYLQKMYVPCYVGSHSLDPKNKKKRPPALDYKIKLRSEESYTMLCKKTEFLNKRRERNYKENEKERVCHYKFWEPPSTLRNTDPKMAAYVLQLRMFKKKGRARYLKYKPPFENLQCHVGNITYIGGRPRYHLQNYCSLPTGYIPHNGGIVRVGSEYVTTILGYYRYPRDVVKKCDSKCNCIATWEASVQKYLQESKCKCGHLYDFGHEGKATEKYFHRPKNGPFWFDQAKIYQLDPWEDFIKDTVKEALQSETVTPVHSLPTISPAGLKEKELLAAFLGDLSDSPLLIPHLPKANLLRNLQEWVRKRIKGPLSEQKHKQLLLVSQRRWLDLKHMDFKARAYIIPFTLKQLHRMNFSDRKMIQKIFETLLFNFTSRNRRKQVEQTRLWWSTMMYDAYPSPAFLDTFFTYMPGRYKDTFVINPYSSERTPHSGGKTCPL